jgi:trimeric autotransporter adhesin
MNIQFSNWQSINLIDLNAVVTGIAAGVADTDSTLSQLAQQYLYIFDGTTSSAIGSWYPYNFNATGSFSGNNPVANNVQLANIDNGQTYRFGGVFNTVNTGLGYYSITGGSFSSITHLLNGIQDYTIGGSLIYTAGAIGGGTITSATINNASGKLTFKGNLSIDTNEVITGGIITEFNFTSLSGEKFSVTNISTSFNSLITSIGSGSDFSAVYNYFLDSNNLAGNDVIAGGVLNDTLSGNAGNDVLVGNAGDDSLDGGAGADNMNGGIGSDTYYVDSISDVVTESVTNALGGGTDTVTSSISYTLGLNVDNLTLTISPLTILNANNLNGTGNTLDNDFKGNDGNNLLSGLAGNDTLNGGAGNDTLDGGLGNDILIGGTGDDTYLVDLATTAAVIATATSTAAPAFVSLQDQIIENADGNDTITLRGSAVLVTATTIDLTGNDSFGNSLANIENLNAAATGATKLNLIGNGLNNIITGNSADNLMNGGTGADTLVGGLGNDTYIVDDAGDIITELLNSGIDTVQSGVTYSLIDTDGVGLNGGNVENLTLTGADNINGTGNAFNNIIIGNSGVNMLLGGLGADTLDGGLGADSLNGGDGADTYLVDDSADVVTEDNALAAGGIDLVKSSASSFTLSANVENLTLIGTDNINGTGNNLANTLTGNDGNNVLDGDAGNDTVAGGLGDDTINGGIGNDNLTGGTGNDSLIGGTGVDVLAGGIGNDTYVIDLIKIGTGAATSIVLQDTITEAASAGNDTIVLTNNSGVGNTPIDLSNPNYRAILTLGANIENLNASQIASTYTAPDGSMADIGFEVTGNTLDNTITSNDASSYLKGLAGNDKLIGGMGDDLLDGGLGADTMTGGEGGDTYVIDNINDVIIETGTGIFQWDTVDYRVNASTTQLTTLTVGSSSNTVNLTATSTANLDLSNIESIALYTTIGKFNLIGDAQDNQLIGNATNNLIDGGAGNDYLDGGAGLDTLIGGAGDDTYRVDSLAEVNLIVDSDNNNTLIIGSSYTLTNTLFNNLYLDGIGAFNATGNDNNNVLYGNSAANILNGGLGADTMDGGDGNDTYIVDDIGDAVVEYNALAVGGIDLVMSSVDFNLSDNSTTVNTNLNLYPNVRDNIEKLTLTGLDHINATGNALANTLTGNANDNMLDGKAGVDILIGGLGNDTYIVDLTATGLLQDTVTEGVSSVDTGDKILLQGNSTNTIASTLTLGANIEILDASATGSSKLNFTGNALINSLTGNAADNILDGGLGADALTGGAGNDTYLVDNIGDNVTEQFDIGTDLVKISIATAGGTYVLGDYVENGVLSNAVAFNLTGNALDNGLTGNAAANTLVGLDGNDSLDGGAGNDSLVGGFGEDSLTGGLGNDTLDGGDGNDIYVVDSALDIISTDTNGVDTVISSVNFNISNRADLEYITLTGIAAINATGNAGNNILKGNDAANTLDGRENADVMSGGKGADIYFVDHAGDTVIESLTLVQGGGVDLVNASVSFTLGTNVENLTLLTASTVDLALNDINATGNDINNVIIGNSGNNALFANEGNDTLIGNAGDDWLDGGSGIDNMSGGDGSDIYWVDNIGDITNETNALAAGGVDTVNSNVTRTLGANLENLTLFGQANINGTGNTFANTIKGNDGNNVLDGGLGVDALIGGDGADTYFVDLATNGVGVFAVASLQDVVTEDLDKGIDTLKLRGAVTLANASTITLGDNIENLDASLTGATKLNLTGNVLDNKLTGNAAANIIDAGDGNDTLDGGAGIDILIGGAGDDTYIVDSLAEASLVSDFAGSNTLNIGLTYTLTNGGSFTNLNLTGAAVINGTGNSLNNTLSGNTAANNLAGLDGDDTIYGGAGADTLNGGLGADSMTGGDGNDVYFVDNALDQVIETNSLAAIGGIDLVQSSITFDLSTSGANVENLTLLTVDSLNLSANNINATGNALNNIIIGNSGDNLLTGNEGNDNISGNAGDDTLDGGADIDALAGGLGNDTYKVDLTAAGLLQDTVTEGLNAGTDTIVLQSSSTNVIASTLILGANIETLDARLTGSSKLNLTGNALINSLTGNAADNILDGGLGADSLTGGAGSDTYLVDNYGDSVTEQFGEGTDLVKISIATVGGFYTLGDNIENGTLTNAVIFELDGNALDNVLTGNAVANVLVGFDGNDTLDGGAGNDSLTGGLGNDSLTGGIGNDTLDGGDGDDTYVVDIATDVIVTDSSGTDTVKSSITYNIANRADLENITLTGLAVIDAKGNDLANTLTGNDAANTLDGGVGADAMNGGKGNDIYIVDDAGDTATESLTIVQGGGIDLVRSSTAFFTLGENIENLTLIGNQAVAGYGNALNNLMTATDFGSGLQGGEGNDTLVGGLGSDGLYGGAGNDVLLGGAGDDILQGLGGIDALSGGKGDDQYYIDLKLVNNLTATSIVALQDTVTENLNEGRDVIYLTNLTGDASGGSIDVNRVATTTIILNANFEDIAATDTGLMKLNITGNTLNNLIVGNDADNVLSGLAGNDNINGGLGNDTLDGGLGADFLSGGQGADVFVLNSVEAANFDALIDFIQGEDKVDLQGALILSKIPKGLFFDMFASGSSATASDDNDFLIYDTSTASLYFDADGVGAGQKIKIAQFNIGQNLTFNDFKNAAINAGGMEIFGSTQLFTNNPIAGGNGDDTIHGGDATGDQIHGGNGNDIIYSASGAAYYADNYFYGEAGSDYLVGGDGWYDHLDGGLGNDTLDGGAGDRDFASYLFDKGGVNIDLRITGPQNTISSGYDTLINIEGIDGTQGPYKDRLIGNDSANFINGNGGSDYISGEGGDDQLSFGYGNCTVLGGAGNDGLSINAVNNDQHIIDGGSGIDTLGFGGAGFAVKVNLSINTAQFTSMSGIPGSGAYITLTNVENLYGSEQNDSLTGNSFDNNLNGNAGNDILNGGAGNDVLNGGATTYFSKLDNDTLIGGLGQDTFVFNTELNGTNNVDVIQDFIAGYDHIQLASFNLGMTIFGAMGTSLDASEFISGAGIATATDADDYIIFNTSNGALYYDADGNGAAYGAVQFATLTGVNTLSAIDFGIV